MFGLSTCWSVDNIYDGRQTLSDIAAYRRFNHYSDVIMGPMTSPISSLTIVYSTVYSGADKRNHQSSASLAYVRGFHWWPMNSPHKWPVTRKMFPFDDVIMPWFSAIKDVPGTIYRVIKRFPFLIKSGYHGYWWAGKAKDDVFSNHFVNIQFPRNVLDAYGFSKF